MAGCEPRAILRNRGGGAAATELIRGGRASDPRPFRAGTAIIGPFYSRRRGTCPPPVSGQARHPFRTWSAVLLRVAGDRQGRSAAA